jgi:ABC-2 type transport system ATP-binding protein
MNMLRYRNISKSFAAKKALDGFSLTVNRGEIYGLLGPNGCGKSTAINILCDLLDPDCGSIEVAGLPRTPRSKRIVGVCPQEIALYRDLDAGENLGFFAQVYGVPASSRRARVAYLLDLLGLGSYAGVPVRSLSGGWQRRVNLAVALVHSPQILVLDEPTSAVDIEARHEIWRIVETLRADGITILLTTHHLDEAERLCTRVGIMKNGCILREGSVEELLTLVPAKAIAYIESADESAAIERAAQLGWGIRRYAGKLGCLLPRHLSLAEIVRALEGIEVTSASVQRVSLEHAYLEVGHAEPIDSKSN